MYVYLAICNNLEQVLSRMLRCELYINLYVTSCVSINLLNGKQMEMFPFWEKSAL